MKNCWETNYILQINYHYLTARDNEIVELFYLMSYLRYSVIAFWIE